MSFASSITALSPPDFHLIIFFLLTVRLHSWTEVRALTSENVHTHAYLFPVLRPSHLWTPNNKQAKQAFILPANVRLKCPEKKIE